MGGHRVFTTQLSDGALHRLGVKAQVVVHQIRLDGIATPCPTVALDTVHEELTGGEIHRIGTHLPYLVHLLVVTLERTTAGKIERQVLVFHADLTDRDTVGRNDIDKSESLAVGHHIVGSTRPGVVISQRKDGLICEN